LTAALVRAYANLANEMAEAGYTEVQAQAIKKEVTFYENLRNEIKLHSGDAIDLKRYEPAMRHLIDAYIRAEESEKVSAFDDLSLIQLIVERGADAVKALPDTIKKNKEAVAETIENNVRKLIIDESPINPKYYEKMSELLDALIVRRKQQALDYAAYLARIVELTKKVKNGPEGAAYPKSLNTPAKKALYDNLGKNEALAVAVDKAVRDSKQDAWRSNPFKVKKVRLAIEEVLEDFQGSAGEQLKESAPYTATDGRSAGQGVEAVLELVKKQNEY
jgi:type I restriction enzyme R subunit